MAESRDGAALFALQAVCSAGAVHLDRWPRDRSTRRWGLLTNRYRLWPPSCPARPPISTTPSSRRSPSLPVRSAGASTRSQARPSS